MTGPLAYTYETAAAATGLGQSTIRRAVQAGQLKAKRSSGESGKRAGRVVILHDELAAWLNSLEDAEAAS